MSNAPPPGKERRVAIAAPDDCCPTCGAAGPFKSVGSDSQSSWHFTHACDPYKAAERYRRDHPSPDTIQITDEQHDAEAERWHERRRPFTIEDHRGDAEERSGEDRRKRLETRVPLGWWCDDNEVFFIEQRTSEERRQGGDTLTAPDAPRDAARPVKEATDA